MISVVIPSYNRCDCMRALLTDLYRQQGADFEVIVVDDGSKDDTVEMIRGGFPQVRLLVNEINGGPCVSRNRGILQSRGEWIVGFDSDVTLPDTRLLATIDERLRANPRVAGLALRIFMPDGVTEDVERWCHPRPLPSHANRAFLTSYFSGTAYAFRRDAVTAAGLYPELLYMHHEEVELAWRVLDGGGDILYCPDLAVLHHAHSVSRRSEVEVFLMPRNQVLLAASCLPLPEALLYLLPRTAYQGFKAVRNGHFPDFLRAMASAWRMLPRQWELRKPLRRSTLATIRRLRHDPADRPEGNPSIAADSSVTL